MAAQRLLLTTDAVGGVWQYSLELARGLAAAGVEVLLANLGPPPSAELRLAAEASGATLIDTGLPLEWLAAEPQAVEAAAAALARLAEQQQVDLVQLNSPALGCARFAMPVVAVVHSCVASWWEAVKGTALPPDFRWRAELVERGLLAAGRVVAPSAAFAAMVQRCYRLPAPPLTVHNGRSPLASGGPAERQDFAFAAGRLWDEGKNIATLDRAAADLSVPLRTAGPLQGPNGATIALTDATACGALGEREFAALLAARPVFVSAARYEPFGLAVLEAALAGCPLVLSDIPTFRELWSGAATFVVADDAGAFAAAIQALIDDPDERSRRGNAARERAQCYGPEAMGAAMLAVYRGLLHAAEAKAAA